MQKSTDKPSVAVVILNWNGKKYLEQFLSSVIATDYPNFFVVVADNGSTDDSVVFLKENYPQIQLILLQDNFGFAGGYNKALAQVEADYFVLLNSDVEVTGDWLLPLVMLMEGDEKIAACQPKILSLKDRNEFEYAGASGGWMDKYGYPFCRGRVFDVCEDDRGQYDDVKEIFWASGACLMMRPEVFKKSGGFDAYFFAHQEEIDLCWRMKRWGYKIYVQPGSVIYHLGGGSLAMGNKRKVFLNMRNNLIMLYKNMNGFRKWRILLARMVLDGLTGIRFLLQGNWGSFVAVLSAHAGFYKWIFTGTRQATPLPDKNISQKDLTGMVDKSIVFSYFIRKRRTFSAIVENKK